MHRNRIDRCSNGFTIYDTFVILDNEREKTIIYGF